MTTTPFAYQAEEKLAAIKYFPSFFDNSYSIRYSKSLEKLEELLQNHSKQYYLGSDEMDNLERMEVLRGYHYIKNTIERYRQGEHPESEDTRYVLGSYDNLIEEISNYHFTPHSETSYGANQNNSNNDIIFELSLFRPMLLMVLENIACLQSKRSEAPMWTSDIQIHMVELANQLDDMTLTLDMMRRYYQDGWFTAKRTEDYLSDSELGERKTSWRKQKNQACGTILSFLREMNDIDYKLWPYNLVHPHSDIHSLYEDCVDYIVTGPNYYSYLNEEEIKKQAKRNKDKKLALKGKNTN